MEIKEIVKNKSYTQSRNPWSARKIKCVTSMGLNHILLHTFAEYL